MRFTFTLCVLAFLLSPLASQTDGTESSVTGVVSDKATGAPIPYATIACSACVNGGALTNEAGGFEVFPKDGDVQLAVSHILYDDRKLTVSPGTEDLVITLSPLRIDLPTVEVKPARRLKKDPQENPDDYERVFKARYKPRFWRKYPVLTNTPLEQQMILDFEEKGYFGTVSFD